jgi:hypothetical protein
MKNIKLIYIIIALLFAGCKKEKEVEPVKEAETRRIEIRATENTVNINGAFAYVPAVFYWKVGSKHKIKAYSSWGGSFASVSISIYKDLYLDAEASGRESVTIDYEVQP